MTIGSLTLEIFIPASQSLKDKRHVLRSIKDRLRHGFNVSVAETDHQDTWQRAELTVCVVSPDRKYAEGALQAADRLVAAAAGARIVDSATSYL